MSREITTKKTLKRMFKVKLKFLRSCLDPNSKLSIELTMNFSCFPFLILALPLVYAKFDIENEVERKLSCQDQVKMLVNMCNWLTKQKFNYFNSTGKTETDFECCFFHHLINCINDFTPNDTCTDYTLQKSSLVKALNSNFDNEKCSKLSYQSFQCFQTNKLVVNEVAETLNQKDQQEKSQKYDEKGQSMELDEKAENELESKEEDLMGKIDDILKGKDNEMNDHREKLNEKIDKLENSLLTKSEFSKCEKEIQSANERCKRENQLKVRLSNVQSYSASKTTCCSYYDIVNCLRESNSCVNHKEIVDYIIEEKYFDGLSKCKNEEFISKNDCEFWPELMVNKSRAFFTKDSDIGTTECDDPLKCEAKSWVINPRLVVLIVIIVLCVALFLICCVF